ASWRRTDLGSNRWSRSAKPCYEPCSRRTRRCPGGTGSNPALCRQPVKGPAAKLMLQIGSKLHAQHQRDSPAVGLLRFEVRDYARESRYRCRHRNVSVRQVEMRRVENVGNLRRERGRKAFRDAESLGESQMMNVQALTDKYIGRRIAKGARRRDAKRRGIEPSRIAPLAAGEIPVSNPIRHSAHCVCIRGIGA